MEVTIKDVAKYAGVGVGTVSRVINNEKAVGKETRKKVLDAMEALNYSRNNMAFRLRKNETKIIALLVPVISHPFFAKLAYYVEDEASRFGYSVILVSSQQKVDKEIDIITKIKQREVDGAVFVTHYMHKEEELKGCPIVSIDRTFGERIPYVTSDNYDATKNAIKYMIEHGAKSVGFIGSKPLVGSEVMERERAYRDVMAEYGMTPHIVNEIIQHGEESLVVADFIEKYKDVDAVFVSGYTLSQFFYEEALSLGKKIPEELQIVSYDGIFKQWGISNITSVEQPIEEMARQVVRLLIKRIHNEETCQRTVLKTKFILGTTTK
ncbi:MAG: LacI family DNA-binding transcriptional regulator [Clostridia bacterium]|nr:LacI family DNA-binding transcriptional regulator [Clostridia bacterium]MBQ4108192.1 LacI family DNA-binding transcriptional regulator [Clostridia bacterium]